MRTTGQIIVRGPFDQLAEGKVVYGVCGIIAFDPTLNMKGEHQYTLYGSGSELIILPETAQDIHTIDDGYGKIQEGMTYNQLICSPIWRV